jgi:hypothetical protein
LRWASILTPRTGRLGLREAVLAWVQQRASVLNALGRCDEDDRCPDCRADEPCPLDLWPDVAAAVALGEPERYARGFFEMTGKEAGTGAFTSWLKRGFAPRVCHAAMCVEHWRDVEMYKRAEQVIELGWHAGSRHPDLADAYAGQLAAAAGSRASTGRSRSATTPSTPPTVPPIRGGAAYGHAATSSQDDVSGCSRSSGEVDEDGNPIPARRHHPTRPRRHARPTRFVGVLDRDGS